MLRINWSYKPWLSILTLHMQSRPQALARNLRSVARQSIPVEQIIITDPVPDGSGFQWFADTLKAAALLPQGEYVMTLDDDDELGGSEALDGIYTDIRNVDADVAMCQFDLALPDGRREVIPPIEMWGKYPQHGRSTGGGVIVRREVWQNHLHHLVDIGNGIYSADYSLVKSYFDAGRHVIWIDEIVARSQFRGLGRPEREAVAHGV